MKFVTLPQVGDMYTAYIVFNTFTIFNNKNSPFKPLLQFSVIHSIRTLFWKLKLLQAVFVISFPR